MITPSCWLVESTFVTVHLDGLGNGLQGLPEGELGLKLSSQHPHDVVDGKKVRWAGKKKWAMKKGHAPQHLQMLKFASLRVEAYPNNRPDDECCGLWASAWDESKPHTVP
jgi:hypothetical protein